MAEKIQQNRKYIVPKADYCVIYYDKFHEYMASIKKHYLFLLDVSSGPLSVDYPTLIDEMIDLLTDACGDREEEWIYYWVYELKCGTEYHIDSVTNSNGKPIPLRTIDDLWNVVNTRYK